jgi:membrane protein DedA with SNARE-associated domain
MEQVHEICLYFAAFFGSFIEGEVLFVGSILTAKMGAISLWWIFLVVYIGAYFRDYLTFIIFRKKGKAYIAQKPKLQNRLNKIQERFDNNQLVYLLFYRMLYGFRNMLLILAGISNISHGKFIITSLVANLIWLGFFGAIGIHCSDAFLMKIDWIKANPIPIIIGIIGIIGLHYLIKRNDFRFAFWRCY